MSVFRKSDADIGLAAVAQHRITLTDQTPIYQRPRRFPPPITDEIERQCKELNAQDIIEPSDSPWSSPVVPVRKKDGSIRMCIDYRRLNRVTVADKYPVPNLTDSIFGLGGAVFFTTLDMLRSYYQVPVHEDSRQCTAFSTPKSHWQFKRLSFGLRNAPAAFQRGIQGVLSSFPSNKVIAYIDDILIMSKTFEEHVELVSKVLETLMTYGFKIKLSKCEWFKSEVEFLGHLISLSGIRKTPAYTERVLSFAQPKTVGELREFLGLVNFQRKYLPNCSEIQKPLSRLTGGRKNKVLTWTTEMAEAFERLKADMKIDIELAYPDYSDGAAKLELWVDASARGAGAWLAQQQGDVHRRIGCASMTFSDTQLNYSTLERELTALRWGVKTFRPFLYGISFILLTDHQPLVHLHNMKIVCSRLARTVEELADFSFEIRYVPGRLNSAADALSRLGVPASHDEQQLCGTIPEGLVLDGAPTPGGGDALFTSLVKCLSRVACPRAVPGSEMEMRAVLCDDLLGNAHKYKIQLDRDARRQIRLMRHNGQLPSLEVLLSASRLFHVSIHVYFWSDRPVIYQYMNYPSTIHIQSLNGIHFNPLTPVLGYSPPDLTKCSVYSCVVSLVTSSKPAVGHNDTFDTEDELTHELAESLMYIDEAAVFCPHPVSRLPQVTVSFGSNNYCAVLDTGAEISLITRSALNAIREHTRTIGEMRYVFW